MRSYLFIQAPEQLGCGQRAADTHTPAQLTWPGWLQPSFSSQLCSPVPPQAFDHNPVTFTQPQGSLYQNTVSWLLLWVLQSKWFEKLAMIHCCELENSAGKQPILCYSPGVSLWVLKAQSFSHALGGGGAVLFGKILSILFIISFLSLLLGNILKRFQMFLFSLWVFFGGGRGGGLLGTEPRACWANTLLQS